MKELAVLCTVATVLIAVINSNSVLAQLSAATNNNSVGATKADASQTLLILDSTRSQLELKEVVESKQPESVYPETACDPSPLLLEPVGPYQTFETSNYDDDFVLTAWRYPCDENFSWIVFTIEPKTESDKPFICSAQIAIQQDGIEDDTLKLCSDPFDEYCNSKCGDVFTKTSYAFTKRSISSESIDLNGELLLYWEVGDNHIQTTIEAYDQTQYGYEPRIDNQLAVNGLYYDPNNSGHGFDFKLSEYGLTIYYYGHTSSGERLWLISGLYKDDVEIGVPFTRNMKELVDGTFNAPNPPTTVWGTITVTFNDCNSGTIVMDGVDGYFEMNFDRLAGLEGIECSRFSSNLE